MNKNMDLGNGTVTRDNTKIANSCIVDANKETYYCPLWTT